MTADAKDVVVIGAGLAGAGVVRGLRAHGFGGEVLLLGAEGVPPYDRPPLSKELLTRTEPAWLAEQGYDLAAEVRPDDPAVGLSRAGDRWLVATASGEVSGAVVVLATGARAVRPWPDALTLHTADDAARLRSALTPGAHLVIIGAGWIGAEVAGVAAAAGIGVTVVEAAPTPLATALGATGGLTAPWYAAAGVRLLTGATVVGVTPETVRLATGETLAADVVLAAVGARPNTAWLGDLIPLVGREVAVDEWQRVLGAPGLLAVGDVARRRSSRHGWVGGGHWDGALRGAETAALGLVATTGQPPDAAPYVFSTQFGRELALFGEPAPGDEVLLRGDPETFTALWLRADRLAAALTVDRPRDAAAARRLFAGAELVRLDRAVAANADRPLREAAR